MSNQSRKEKFEAIVKWLEDFKLYKQVSVWVEERKREEY